MVKVRVLEVARWAKEIAPWVSASLSQLQAGHGGEYEKVAEAFLAAVVALEQAEASE